MSKRRRMRHVQVDAGDGITAMVRMRGPMTPELNDAFAALARAAATRMEQDANEGVEPLTPRTSWRMPQGRGDLGGCGAHDQTVGPCAGEASPADERGSTGGTDTSSASGRVARPHSGEDT